MAKSMQLGVYVEPAVYNRLREISKATRVPMSEYVRDAIDLVLKRHKDVKGSK